MHPRRTPPAVLALLVGGFLLLRAALFAFATNGDYSYYHRYALAASGTSTAELYRTHDVEYPPLAVQFAVAALRTGEALPPGSDRFAAWRPNENRGPDGGELFQVGLGVVLFVADLACLALVCWISRRVYPDDGPRLRLARPLLYVAGSTAHGLIFYDRLDPVVALVAVLALAAFVRGWAFAAYAVIAAGVAFKLVPLLLLPLWVLAFATKRAAPGDSRRFLVQVVREAAIAGAILAAVPALIYLLCGGERGFVFLWYHSARGLQLEASPGWVVLLWEPGTEVIHSFESYTLRGALADRVAKACTLATVAGAVFAVLVAGRGFWRAATGPGPAERNGLVTHLVAGSLLAWIGFMLFVKVGSPQYWLWLTPLAPLLPLRGSDRWWVGLLLIGMVATALIYPCCYLWVRGLENDDGVTWSGPTAFGFALLALRAALLVALFVWLAAIVWRDNPAPSPPLPRKVA